MAKPLDEIMHAEFPILQQGRQKMVGVSRPQRVVRREEAKASLEASIEHFKAFHLRAKQRSPETAKWYLSRIHRLLDWLKEQGIERPGEVDLELLEQLKLELSEYTELEATSVNGHIRAWKKLFNHLEKFQIIDRTPARWIEQLREEDLVPETLSDAECLALLGAFDRRTFEGLRNHTMLLMLLATGLRSGELRQLRLDDIDPRDRTIHVRPETSKSRRERHVPFDQVFAHKLAHYLRRRTTFFAQSPWPDTPYLFPALKGGKCLTASGVYHQVVRKAFEVGGVSTEGRKAGPHLLRHTFAHRWLLINDDLRTLQLVLGHSRITTTEKYTKLLKHELREKADRVSPLAKLLSARSR